MEEKNDFNYNQDENNLLIKSLEKLNKKIEHHGENIKKFKTKLEQHGEKIEKVQNEIKQDGEKFKTELEQNGEKIEKVEKEVNELKINISFIFGLFNSLQNIKNNNDENEILNDLEEVEFNGQFKNNEEIKCTICF